MGKFSSLESAGFAVAPALQQLAGSEKLYLSVITKFYDAYETLPDSIRADLQNSDFGKIQRDAHTVKGLAGTIGHSGLREVAEKLEYSASKGDAAACEAALGDFVPVFGAVMAALQAVITA